jgi:hypothetical protein
LEAPEAPKLPEVPNGDGEAGAGLAAELVDAKVGFRVGANVDVVTGFTRFFGGSSPNPADAGLGRGGVANSSAAGVKDKSMGGMAGASGVAAAGAFAPATEPNIVGVEAAASLGYVEMDKENGDDIDAVVAAAADDRSGARSGAARAGKVLAPPPPLNENPAAGGGA